MAKETWCKGEKCPVKNACKKHNNWKNSIFRSNVRACDIKIGVNEYSPGMTINLIRHCTNQKAFERYE